MDQPLFQVNVDADGVSIARIEPGKRGYASAAKGAIIRHRDAIELFQGLKNKPGALSGRFTFHHLETAKTFSILVLESFERRIQENFDRIQAYDGDIG